jgi:hypothetical protein
MPAPSPTDHRRTVAELLRLFRVMVAIAQNPEPSAPTASTTAKKAA